MALWCTSNIRIIIDLIALNLLDFVGVLSVQFADRPSEVPLDLLENVQGLFRVDQIDGQAVLAEPTWRGENHLN